MDKNTDVCVIPLSKIVIGDRLRQDKGNLDTLKVSIVNFGLLQPLAITPDNRLVAGVRRLEVLKKLGWDEVPCRIVHDLDTALQVLQAERDENTCRRDFTPEEAVHAGRQIEKLEREEAKRRQGRSGHERSGELPEHRKGQTRDKIGKAVGMGGSTYEHARVVVEAAEEDPNLRPLVDQMNATGNVNGAYKELTTRRRRQERLRNLEVISKGNGDLPERKHPILIVDPPWRYDFSETDNRRIENQYPTMSQEELIDLPVGDLALDDSVIYLWATAPKLVEAIELLHAWGFSYKSNMTWIKERLGMGYWARGRHEHILIATRGSMPPPAPWDRPDSVLESPRRRHSEKPKQLYEIIERAYPTLSKIEMFARTTRDGWDSWGNQAS